MKLNRCPNNKSTAKVADIADDNRASSASATITPFDAGLRKTIDWYRAHRLS
jgi:dTDP-D-glucose 4,6-dehydratase